LRIVDWGLFDWGLFDCCPRDRGCLAARTEAAINRQSTINQSPIHYQTIGNPQSAISQSAIANRQSALSVSRNILIAPAARSG
jgi:hypothetical protein